MARVVRCLNDAGMDPAEDETNDGRNPMFGLGIIGTILLILLILSLLGVL